MSIPSNPVVIPEKIIFARAEEIGDPRLMTGRKAELAYFLKWCAGVKRLISPSIALLARRKRGKTALMERLHNIVWTWGDPRLVPFYFRVLEQQATVVNFSDVFYRSLLTQILKFRWRTPPHTQNPLEFEQLEEAFHEDVDVLIDIRTMRLTLGRNNCDNAWDFARSAGDRLAQVLDVRIVQFIDEFQYLNEYYYWDDAKQHKAELCGGYQHEAESKVSPQLISGSYVGWLTTIIRHMVSRYREYELGPLTRDEAVEQVYNYSSIIGVPVSDETAPQIAAVCHDDPYYISQVIRSDCPGKDLTSSSQLSATFDFETGARGQISRMWMEYVWIAFPKVNDENAKRIVLYLAAADGYRTRAQIRADLRLKNISESKLDERLRQLVKADILAEPINSQTYAGLGDPVFGIVFRRVYEAEMSGMSNEMVEEGIRKAIRSLQGQVSYYKGLAGEYRALNMLVMAANAGARPTDFADNTPNGWDSLGGFKSFRKHTIHLEQNRSVELDGLMESQDPDGWDIALEVKNWDIPVDIAAANTFIEKKRLVSDKLRVRCVFLFLAENGAAPDAAAALADAGVALTTPSRIRAAIPPPR